MLRAGKYPSSKKKNRASLPEENRHLRIWCKYFTFDDKRHMKKEGEEFLSKARKRKLKTAIDRRAKIINGTPVKFILPTRGDKRGIGRVKLTLI